MTIACELPLSETRSFDTYVHTAIIRNIEYKIKFQLFWLKTYIVDRASLLVVCDAPREQFVK